MKRKLMSILLIVLLSATLLVPAAAEDAPAVTRAGWISQLVQTFGLTVENENYPDNYYSDLMSDRSDYHDILTAVEFGLVDLDLGEAFRPDEAATREFAAQTLNYCLGYQLDADAEYTFSEAADMLTYPADLQIALNRGWFQLVNGEVLPAQPLTAAEQTAMLADAKAALLGEVIDPEHENSYTFTADVVEIPDGTAVTVSDGVIRVLDCPVEVAKGNIIAVYQNGIPTIYTVNSVSKELTTLVLGITQLENTEDIYTGIDAQGTVEASLEDVVPPRPRRGAELLPPRHGHRIRDL